MVVSISDHLGSQAPLSYPSIQKERIMIWIRMAAILGGLAVALGAFGAHGLESNLPPDPSPTLMEPSSNGVSASEGDAESRPPLSRARRLEVYETGVTYHMSHALVLLAVGLLGLHLPSNRTGWLKAAGASFLVGILVFSGSLYLMALTGLRWLGAITPIGGVAFLVGWACLALAARHAQRHHGDEGSANALL